MSAAVAMTPSATRLVASAPLGFLIGLSLGALGGGGSILAGLRWSTGWARPRTRRRRPR
ncbi:hypothetical protein [Candidatus Mycobacterium methanotrophicum]|uniref:Uncharacterized protein n=1 Tax=Candidatus Mycobacterium methanotrophicum TaxID=2943498 RepID=A0ABY4QJT9_9MYCO|nr:hypothetical protein [Candidatus Mycobacterium methanotrophicum]UQX11285.1 hypothetical protein M5I08_01715 [Candidatus Mycobacterium methanotrophicum]